MYHERCITMIGDTLIGLLHVPQWGAGTEPATQACAVTGNRTYNISVCGVMFQLRHTGQGRIAPFQ